MQSLIYIRQLDFSKVVNYQLLLQKWGHTTLSSHFTYLFGSFDSIVNLVSYHQTDNKRFNVIVCLSSSNSAISKIVTELPTLNGL